jgi:2-iminoacetate synthase
MEKKVNFIEHQKITEILENNKEVTAEKIEEILEKGAKAKGLSLEEVALLLNIPEGELSEKLFSVAGQIKKDIYGDRIVVFAPLYISDYCVNNCTYCGYKRDNKFKRKKLTTAEIQDEVRLLEKMGHKRLALEVGEDPVNCDINYVLQSIRDIYETPTDTGAIRRINVNIAATTVENYRKLKDAGIGTYILFQETYHKPIYEKMHPKSLKSDYLYHLTAFHRAMEGGVDDVGAGILFGLAPWQFEILALLMHNTELEKDFGVGFHTVSVPRLKKAEGMDLGQYPDIIDDFTFKKIVAILRIALPFVGIILSTRESAELRKEVIKYGVSQVSAGSCVGVGGYKDVEEGEDSAQFIVSDHRTPLAVLKDLLKEGYIPSYCTACYRSGRTGDRFMELAKSGNIQNVCQPNALMTLLEYALDFGDDELKATVDSILDREVEKIKSSEMKEVVKDKLARIKAGERDLFV